MTEVIPIIIAVVIVVLCILLRIYRSTIKGKIGEMRISLLLSFLPSSKYIVINDVMLNFNGRTTQIDHIVVSVYGIFVIETKNYKGWIYGNANREYWTQNIWGHKYNIYNPIIQNKSHLEAVRRLFENYGEYKLIPIIVFNRAKSLRISGDSACVVYKRGILRYIKQFDEIVFTFEQCRFIADVILLYNITDNQKRKSHKKYVKEIIRKRSDNVRNRICPRCGGALILRKSVYGSFYGCSNFPNCKYLIDIKDIV